MRCPHAACREIHVVSTLCYLITTNPSLIPVSATTGGSTPSSAAQKRAQAAKPKSKKCQRGFESCPVFGVLLAHGYGRTYECIDTQNDLESCGGCVDNDSISGERNIHGGRDCSAIPNVDNVRCSRGRCIIGTSMHVTGFLMMSLIHILLQSNVYEDTLFQTTGSCADRFSGSSETKAKPVITDILLNAVP